jgi:hypothetical protein
LEIRILTRCAGLVEISEHRTYLLPKLACKPWVRDFPEVRELQGKEFITRHIREASFTHRTAMEFLESHFEDLFQEPNWRLKGRLAYANSQLGYLSILPCVILPARFIGRRPVALLIRDLMRTISRLDDFAADGQTDESFEDAAIEIVSHSFQAISHACKKFDCQAGPWYESFDGGNFGWYTIDQLPFRDCQGFAAFFDCRKYISRYLSSHSSSSKDCTDLLRCSLVGYMCYDTFGSRKRVKLNQFYVMMEELLRQEVHANLPTRMRFWECCDYEVSLWGLILQYMIHLTFDDNSDQGSQTTLRTTSLVEKALSHGADINTSIFRRPPIDLGNARCVVLEDRLSPLLKDTGLRRGFIL